MGTWFRLSWQKIRSMPHWLWQKIKQNPIQMIIIIVVGIAIFITIAYLLNWEWAGFDAVNSRIWTIRLPNTFSGKTIFQIEEQQQAKTLWDWLNLLGVLAIPVVVGFGVTWFTSQQAKVSEAANKRQHETEIQISTDNQREAALQAYIDKMAELLLEKGLRDSKLGQEVRNVARVRTLSMLHQLDTRRTNYLFKFLRESGLITADTDKSIVTLSHADLRKVNLKEIDFHEVNLSKANLEGANLEGASLHKANLEGANLRGASLREADLEKASLILAKLSLPLIAKWDKPIGTFKGNEFVLMNLSKFKLVDPSQISAFP